MNTKQAKLPARIKNYAKGELPATYAEAKKALQRCQRIDECKKWKDKMAALASYAKQAGDGILLRYATQIKNRAIRRAGEILKEVKPGKTGPKLRVPKDPELSRTKAAKNAGLSEKQKKQALQVANVPEAEFEAAVEAEPTATTKELADKGKTKKAKPDPLRGIWIDWTSAVQLLSSLPECGLPALAERIPSEIPRLIGDAEDALQYLQEWLRILREKDDGQGAQAQTDFHFEDKHDDRKGAQGVR